MAIQNRRGADADFDSHKMLPGELAVTTDGTRKAYAAFAPGDVREIAFKDQVPIVGNITPAEVQTAVDNYLAENPVHAGATEEQAKQIELNRKNIEANLEKDYIVEQGIDGIWTYRKWKSGIAECWACQSAEISIDKPWASLFYGSVQGAKFPNSLFVTEPQVYASVLNSSLWLTISDVSQESVGILYLTSAASYENINYTLNYKAIGRWK